MDDDCYTSSDSDSNCEGATYVIIDGATVQLKPGGGSTVINAPGLRNIQIGDGRCTYVGHKQHDTPRTTANAQNTSKKLSESTLPPSKSDLEHVCDNIGRRWKKLASALGFSRGMIEAIEIDFSVNGTYEMAWQTLLKWKRQNGENVRTCDLVKALDSVGLTELARDIPLEQ